VIPTKKRRSFLLKLPWAIDDNFLYKLIIGWLAQESCISASTLFHP
jgi:hypothetical protein